MPYELADAPPWGRSYQEYDDMFFISSCKSNSKILGCADGPASFNYEASQKGFHVISFDPIYARSAQEIKDRVTSSAGFIQKTVEQNREDYNWNYLFESPEHLTKCRLRNMELFLNDYQKPGAHQRYINGSLPILPFQSNEFDIAVVSNLLFLYDNYLDCDFHIKSITELCRVAKEVRIFPLTSTLGYESQHLTKVLEYFGTANYAVDKLKSNYTFIKIAKETLIIRKLM